MKKNIVEYYICPICGYQKVHFVSNEGNDFFHCNYCHNNFCDKEYTLCSSCGMALIRRNAMMSMCKNCYDYTIKKIEKD